MAYLLKVIARVLYSIIMNNDFHVAFWEGVSTSFGNEKKNLIYLGTGLYIIITILIIRVNSSNMREREGRKYELQCKFIFFVCTYIQSMHALTPDTIGHSLPFLTCTPVSYVCNQYDGGLTTT